MAQEVEFEFKPRLNQGELAYPPEWLNGKTWRIDANDLQISGTLEEQKRLFAVRVQSIRRHVPKGKALRTRIIEDKESIHLVLRVFESDESAESAG